MKVQPIIDALAPLVTAGTVRTVEGVASIPAIFAGGAVPTPALYVVDLGDVPVAPNELINGVMQRVSATFGLVIVTSNQYDGRGKAASDEKDAIRLAARAILLGWTHADMAEAAEYAGGQMVDFDDQLLVWQDQYVAAYYERSIP